MTVPAVTIDGRKISPSEPPYVIAELSCNHNGSFERAIEILEIAKARGADALKLQTYTPDTMTINHDGPDFVFNGGLWDGMNLYQLYEKAHTPWEWHAKLFEKGRQLGITVFSTPFDLTAVDFLEDLGSPSYKIASFEAVDIPLIEKAASTGKPLIISTGMADLTEVNEAVDAARRAGCKELILLHCVSGYPTPPDESNLLTIPEMAKRFDVPVGLSDHTLGTAVSIGAVALGACVLEKHLILDRGEGGFDAEFSIEPNELDSLCREAKTVWHALGKASYERKKSEQEIAPYRRSLYVTENIECGEKLTEKNVRPIRPGHGLAPKFLPEILGRRATKAVKRGTPLSWDIIDQGWDNK